jgi:enterobactin synthetase component D
LSSLGCSNRIRKPVEPGRVTRSGRIAAQGRALGGVVLPCATVSSPRLFPDLSVAECARSYSLDEAIDLTRLPAELLRAVRKRQVEFLAGRDVACRALSLIAPELADSAIGVGPMREPLWPTGIVGSITHASGHVGAAVASRRDVTAIGIDSEAVVSTETLEQTAAAICRPSEQHWVRNDRVTLTLIFSAKESLYKCLAPLVRQLFDFQDAELEQPDFAAGRFTIRLKRDLTPEFRRELALTGRFVLAPGFVHTGIALLAG